MGSKDIRYPQVRGELFETVQRSGVLDDSKTFVDSVPTGSPSEIRQRFESARDDPDFDLDAFVAEYFSLPEQTTESPELPDDATMTEHINRLWDHLTVEPQNAPETSTRISLSTDYVVPGGRFREVYYWDSYFTAEGLAAAGRLGDVENFCENFADLVAEFGFVPNGNRTYYTGRSQIPFFAPLVGILTRERGPEAAEPYLDALEREYEFWMDGSESVSADSPARRRVVRLGDGVTLNRYWDDTPEPRPESYAEDVALAESVPPEDRERLYRDVRAACESGWDFSSRWLAERGNLASIRTTDLLPVDLNAMLYELESSLSTWFDHAGAGRRADRYAAAADTRREALTARCWDDDRGFFFDYCWATGQRADVWSLSAVVPLFTGMATPEQAAAVAETLEDRFLHDGGLVTTLTETGEQWDAPNGWAPLQWMAVVGLWQYGHVDLAREVARRWLDLNRAVFRRTGKLMEKYNVADTSLEAGGGEYPLQDGFGWTNGVALGFETMLEAPEQSESVGAGAPLPGERR